MSKTIQERLKHLENNFRSCCNKLYTLIQRVEQVEEQADNAIFTIELIDELSIDFYAPADLKINTITNIVANPTIVLKVNDVVYTLGTLITQGDKITVEADIQSVINLNIKYE